MATADAKSKISEYINSKQRQIELYGDIHGLWCRDQGSQLECLYLVSEGNAMLNILSKYTISETSGAVNSLRSYDGQTVRPGVAQTVPPTASFADAFPPDEAKVLDRKYFVFPRQHVETPDIDFESFQSVQSGGPDTIVTIRVFRPNRKSASPGGTPQPPQQPQPPVTEHRGLEKVMTPHNKHAFLNKAIFPHLQLSCDHGNGPQGTEKLLTVLPPETPWIQLTAANADKVDGSNQSRDSLYFYMLFRNVQHIPTQPTHTSTQQRTVAVTTGVRLISFSCKKTGIRWTIETVGTVAKTHDKRLYHLYRDGVQPWGAGDPFYRFEPLKFVGMNVVLANVFPNLHAVTEKPSGRDIFETFRGRDLNADALQTRAARHLCDLI